MKIKHPTLSLLLAGIALSGEPTTPTQAPDHSLITAHKAVESQVLIQFQNSGSRAMFSRVGPPPPPILAYAPVQTVQGEARLPFTITHGRRKTSLHGYVRVSDNAVFIVDTATGQATPAAEHASSNLIFRISPAKTVYP